jgi:superfamily II DNA/RNA helicase
MTPVDVVVATPKSFLTQFNLSNVAIGDLQFLVIDEADTIFSGGFSHDLFQILGPLKRRQGGPLATVLVSATMSRPVREFLAKEFPNMQRAETSTLHKAIRGSNHVFVPLEPGQNKLEVLYRVRAFQPNMSTILSQICPLYSFCEVILAWHCSHIPS